MDRGGLFKVESYYMVKEIILFSIRKGAGREIESVGSNKRRGVEAPLLLI